MRDNATTMETLFEKADNYGKTSIELLRLKAVSKSTDVASTLVVEIVVFVVAVLFLIILNIGIALWLGELLGKPYFGFFVDAGVNALVALLLSTIFRKSIKVSVSNFIITKLLKQELV